jgi:hypothetical protein
MGWSPRFDCEPSLESPHNRLPLGDRRRAGVCHFPQCSGNQAFRSGVQKVPSIARVAAGAFGFLIFSHAFDGPDLYGASSQTRQP